MSSWPSASGKNNLVNTPSNREVDDAPALRFPDFPIVDTHVHLYDPARFTYAWLEGAPLLCRPHLPEDYLEAIGPINVDKAVFVEVAAEDHSSQEEVAWVSRLGSDSEWLRGIVANAPLEKGSAVREHLDALKNYPLVRGIRRIISPPYRTDPEFCLRPSFVEGVNLLAQYGFAFDLGTRKEDLTMVRQLVRGCPNVRFVIDHLANPGIQERTLEPWKKDLAELATAPNVFCKISGMIPNGGPNWSIESLTPYVTVALECFGLERVMFGSDWPVMDAAGGSYERWVDALCRITQGLSHHEQRNLFRDNAIRFYDL